MPASPATPTKKALPPAPPGAVGTALGPRYAGRLTLPNKNPGYGPVYQEGCFTDLLVLLPVTKL